MTTTRSSVQPSQGWLLHGDQGTRRPADSVVRDDAMADGPALVIRLLLLLLLAVLPVATPVWAETYRCGGDPLNAQLFPGAVDAAGIPNSSAGTVPGAFVQLRWRDLTLQLPRTNNAGAPSFTDGIWWWSLEDPAHPGFRHRLARGQSETIACEAG